MKRRHDQVEDEEEVEFSTVQHEEDVSSSESSCDSEDENENGDRLIPLTGRKAMMAAHASKPEFIQPTRVSAKVTTGKDEAIFRNRQRVLLLCSRGITQRYRHLLKDLEILLPHARKESKYDSKGNLTMLNELADLNNCNNSIYLECRKKQDLYMWLSKTPNGPSAKFLIQNVHTMDELKMAGNCLKGSRPFLSFDKSFDNKPQYRLLKEMLIHTFGTPKGHRKSKPFFDHVFTFTIADERIWFRHYQIVEKIVGVDPKEVKEEINLVEIGPRFVMTPIRMFEGSFGGPTLWQNEEYVSPNTMRADARAESGHKYVKRHIAEQERKRKVAEAVPPVTEMSKLDGIFRE